MAIYGTAILSLCVITGLSIGKWLGSLLGLDANVGGVGIAMLLLIFATDRLRSMSRFTPESESGVVYWNAIYVPIVVAIAATQNVRAALHAGPVAILAGAVTVAACFALVPVLCKIGKRTPAESDE